MMRVGYIIPSISISGGVNVVLTHANYLLSRGHDVFVVTMSSETEISWRKNDCPVYSWSDDDIWPLVHRRQNDLLVVTGWQTVIPLLDVGFLANHYIYFVQSDERRFHPTGSIERQLAGVTYGVNFSYLTEAKWIKDWLGRNGIEAFYARNGVDDTVFYPSDPIVPRSNKLRVLLEGPLSIPFKGVRDAYVAIANLGVEIWLVSSDGQPDVSMKVDYFFEHVPLNKMRFIYSSCDVLLKLSKVEGVFGPPLEMMACGGTAVTSDVTGHDEFMSHGINSFVCKDGDIKLARDYISQLAADKALLAKLKNGGIQTAKQFDWKSTLESIENWFSSLSKVRNVGSYDKLFKSESFRDAAAVVSNSFQKLYNYPPSFRPQKELTFSFTPTDVYLIEVSGWAWPPAQGNRETKIGAVFDQSTQTLRRPDVEADGFCPAKANAGYLTRMLVQLREGETIEDAIHHIAPLAHTGANRQANPETRKGSVERVSVKRMHSLTINKNNTAPADDLVFYFSGEITSDIEIAKSGEPFLSNLAKLTSLHTSQVGDITVVWTDHYAMLHARENSTAAVHLFIDSAAALNRIFSGSFKPKVADRRRQSLPAESPRDIEVERNERLLWYNELRANALESKVCNPEVSGIWSHVLTALWSSRRKRVDGDPLMHDREFLRRLVEASGLFDSEFYMASNPDVARNPREALNHYLEIGGGEGRAASRIFDSRAYLDDNPDVAKAGMNPLIHYLCYGIMENRNVGRAVGHLPKPRKISSRSK